MLTAVVEAGVVADPDRPSPPVPWWSLTKTALAAGALALAAQCRLVLDAPLRDHPFTLRQLLQHTSGLPDYGSFSAYHEAVARSDEPWDDGELLRRVGGAEKLLFAPGAGWAYSNVGYLFVRRLIEAAMGTEIGVALHQLVFAPLGLPGVRLARAPRDLSTTAWGNASGYHPGWVYHGLLVGTPTEAALFFDRLLAGQLLPAALMGAMLDSRPVGGPVAGRPWRSPAYGLGLMTDDASPLGRCLGHSGAGPGSTSAAYHFPDLDPPRTAAAFAPVDDIAIVERTALGVP